MVAFNNIYGANLSTQYVNCILAAEQFIAAHWTNSITINLDFESIAGGTSGPNSAKFFTNYTSVSVSYAALRNALVAHANNSDAQTAVATLPDTDPTTGYAGSHLWSLPEAYARMLGLGSAPPPSDAQITLNVSWGWDYGQDVIGALEHEITQAAMGRVGGLGDPLTNPLSSPFWSTLDLFRWSSAHFRDFTDGRDGLTTYFSVDGNTLLLPFHNQRSHGTQFDSANVGNFDVTDVFGFGNDNVAWQPGNDNIAFSSTDYKVMNVLGWTPAAFTAGPLAVSAAGDFNGDGISDFIWRRASDAHMGMWSYNATTQLVVPTDLGTVDPNWVVLGSDVFTPAANSSQMLMDYVPSGTMTVWWVNNGQLTGIDLGQKWINVAYVATGGSDRPFTDNAGGRSEFLVSNLTDHHLYDWWIGGNNTLQGVDLGPSWTNVSFIATGVFTNNNFNGSFHNNLLVSNNVDHHLYDWWIDSHNKLQGIDLGAVWSNVGYVSNFTSPQQGHTIDGFLVANTADHHLYDWWIDSNNTLQGIDLGPAWSNVQLVATGLFDTNTLNFNSSEVLVQNTVDHHLYEWWITPQGQLTGIDLGPYWANVQLVGRGAYNFNGVANGLDELLVRNTTDGHFYEWWIAYNQLQGVDLGPVGDAPGGGGSDPPSGIAANRATAPAPSAAPANASGAMSPAGPTLPPEPAPAVPTMPSPPIATSPPTTSSDSTSLLVQAMASFGTSAAVDNSAGAVLTAGLPQLSETLAPGDQRIAHG